MTRRVYAKLGLDDAYIESLREQYQRRLHNTPKSPTRGEYERQWQAVQDAVTTLILALENLNRHTWDSIDHAAFYEDVMPLSALLENARLVHGMPVAFQMCDRRGKDPATEPPSADDIKPMRRQTPTPADHARDWLIVQAARTFKAAAGKPASFAKNDMPWSGTTAMEFANFLQTLAEDCGCNCQTILRRARQLRDETRAAGFWHVTETKV
jgi:hypothetical protein